LLAAGRQQSSGATICPVTDAVLSYDDTVRVLRAWCGKRAKCFSRAHPEEPDFTGVMFEDDEWTPGVRFVVPIEPPTQPIGTARWFAFDADGLALAEWVERNHVLWLGFDSKWSVHPTEDIELTLEGPGWMP
jgi:hypothetical protein